MDRWDIVVTKQQNVLEASAEKYEEDEPAVRTTHAVKGARLLRK